MYIVYCISMISIHTFINQAKVCLMISIVNMVNNKHAKLLIMKTYIVSKIQNTGMTFLFNY